jgi:hypothetical protein
VALWPRENETPFLDPRKLNNLTLNLLEDVMKKSSQKVILRHLGEIFIPVEALKPIQRQGVVKELPLCCVSPLNPEGVKKSIWFFFTSFRRKPESRRRPGESREPFYTLGPDFHRESWTPVFIPL